MLLVIAGGGAGGCGQANDIHGGGGGAGGAAPLPYASTKLISATNYVMIGNGGVGLHKINISGTDYKFKELFNLPTNTSVGYYFAGGTYNLLTYEEGVYFGGGGAGGVNTLPAATSLILPKGGLGGGGDGTTTDAGRGTIGFPNTGGGGGGSEANTTVGGQQGGSGIVIIRYKYKSGTSSTSTQPITIPLQTSIIKSTITQPILVKENINEIYYSFTTQETIEFRQDIKAQVYMTDGTTSLYSSNISFEPNKLYTINPTTQTITVDSIAITIDTTDSTTSSITGESITYTEPTIIIRYSRITAYEYGKGGNINTPGNSGAIIIRYNYYDQQQNPERVILQKPGYLNPYSYIWRGDQSQTIDDSFISINNPSGILNNNFLSINFWLERSNYNTKDYIFAITELNPYNEIIGIGVDNSNFFVNILGSSNITQITNTPQFLHYSVEIDFINNSLAIYNTEIASEDRLNTDTSVTPTTFLNTTYTPTISFNTSNLYSREFKATIGDIHDETIIEYDLSPNGIEDFRIYNKTLQTVIPNVAPLGIINYQTLFMTGYVADTSNGSNVTATNSNIDLQFYNLSVADGGILKNIGNLTSDYNVTIHNATYSNLDVITYKVIDETLSNLDGRSGFQWNKIENNYYENSSLELAINDLYFKDDKDMNTNIYFKLKLKSTISTYPIEIINKNNEITVSMNSDTVLIVTYFVNKIKYVKEFTIPALIVNTLTTFDIVIDKTGSSATLKINEGTSITADTITDLKLWYQFEDDKISKNYSISDSSNISLVVESNIGFISSLSADINLDFSSPYSYYTFLSGSTHTFTVANEMKTSMLMVGGGGVFGGVVSGGVTEVFEYTGDVQTWVKPAGVTEVTAYVWGAGGAGGGGGILGTIGTGEGLYGGGAGGFSYGKINVQNIDSINMLVGQGGETDNNYVAGYKYVFGGGGYGCMHVNYAAGGGAGLSGLFYNNTNYSFDNTYLSVGPAADAIIIAGGGGGGGYKNSGATLNTSKGGGGGGGLSGNGADNAGLTANNKDGGSGGTQIDTDNRTTTTNIERNGKYKGSSSKGGGGGGSGYYGGGGGYDVGEARGAGGGGSGYLNSSITRDGYMVNGTNGTISSGGTITTSTPHNALITNIGNGGFSATSGVNHTGGNGLIVLVYDVYTSDVKTTPGGGGGEVKFYNEITLAPGDYTVVVGDSGSDTTLSSDSSVLYTALNGSSNIGGDAGVNSNANPNITYGFEGGDGYYNSNITTGVITTLAGGGGGMGAVGEAATSNSGGKGGSGLYYNINPYGISYEYGAGGNAVGNVTALSDIVSDVKMNISGTFAGIPESILKASSVEMDASSSTDNVIGPYTFNNDIIYTFKYNTTYNDGSNTSYELTFSKETVCDILVVGGGGGGGELGGGGGAGGVIHAKNKVIPSGTYIIKVGNGGLGGSGSATYDGPGKIGNNSVAFGTTADGGGGGGGWAGRNADTLNTPGGSGGGGGYVTAVGKNSIFTDNTQSMIYSSDTNFIQYGSRGKNGQGSSSRGGGGGGAGGINAGTAGTDGVDGIQIDIDGNNYYWGGGGGGYSGDTSSTSTDNQHRGDGGKGGGGGGGGTGGDATDGRGGTGGITLGGSSIDGTYAVGGIGGQHTGGGGGGGGGDIKNIQGASGGSGIVIIRFTRYDTTPLYPNYSLYTVLPWYQQQLTNIKDAVALKVYNATLNQYETPTKDFVFDNTTLSLEFNSNFTGLYNYKDSLDEYYFYTLKPVSTIPVQTFQYNLTADQSVAYIFAKSYDRKGYIEGNNKDITIYKGDTVKFTNSSGQHILAIKDDTVPAIVTESGSTTEHTFTDLGEYSYYCTSHPVMTGKITVIEKPTSSYNTNSITKYILDIKREVKADILLTGNGKYDIHTGITLMNGTYTIEVPTTPTADAKIKLNNVDTYTSTTTEATYTSSITNTQTTYTTTTGIVIIKFSKSNLENVLTQFGRGANAAQAGTPGLLVLRTENSQILARETTNNPNLPYSYVWSGKTSTPDDKVLVKSTESFTIPSNFTLTFWYYESVNDDVKTDIIKIVDDLKVATTVDNLVFTIGTIDININRPNKYEWNFYGLIFDGTNASVYVNNILMETVTPAFTTVTGNIILGISSEGIAKIADYRFYDNSEPLNISEQYRSFGKNNILNIFEKQVTDYDNHIGYLSFNQNNIKTHILNYAENVIISYKFKGTEDNKYYPIIQFTDYINNTIAPKFEITMKTNKLFISVLFGTVLLEHEYDINCKAEHKSYKITIKPDKTFEVKENDITKQHTPSELIGLYSFEKLYTVNNTTVPNITTSSVFTDLVTCNIDLVTSVIIGETVQPKTKITVDTSNYNYYEMKESGYITFSKLTQVDMVLVGGGAGGGSSNDASQFYGEPGQVNVINTYLEGTYKVDIGSGGFSNMPGTTSTINDMSSSYSYTASGGLTHIRYNSAYSNVYSTFDFGDGVKRYGSYGEDTFIPGSGGIYNSSGKSGILAFREYVSDVSSDYFISRTKGYNLPYAYQWSGTPSANSDKTYLYSTINSTSFLNNDFIISLWCYSNDLNYISLLSIPDVLDINITGSILTFILSDGKATTTLTKKNVWQQFTFVRSNGTLEIYVDMFNKTILQSKPSIDISADANTLYINKTTTISNNFIKPFKISDLRIYNTASKYLINKLGNLPKDAYCYIGANNVTDIAPSILSEFKVNNTGIVPPELPTITYHPVVATAQTIAVENVTVTTTVGNQASVAYEWCNLEATDTLNLSNIYMNVNNADSLINKCYNGFEFSTTYWTKFGSTSNAYEIELSSTEHKILDLKHNSNSILEASLNITGDSNQIITTALDQVLLKDKWYLIAVTGGISDKYLSLSIAAYDSNFTGASDSYISSSVLVPQVADYDYKINNYANTFYADAINYGDVKYYNKFITLVDIYDILQTNSYNTSSTLDLSSSSSETIGFIDGSYSITTANAMNSTLIDIHKFYRMNMSFSFSKNDLALSSDVSDFIIQSDTNKYLTFIASEQPTLNLYSNDILQSVSTSYILTSNVWYDFYTTMNYNGNDTTGEIYIGSNNAIVYSQNYSFSDFAPFNDIDSTIEVRIGVNKDENPLVLNKKIENINIFTKKLNRYTVNNIITKKATAIVNAVTTPVTISTVTGTSEPQVDVLEFWYLLNDFSGDTFNNVIKDSSGKGKDGVVAGTDPTVKTNTNNKNKSNYGLLKNTGKSMKISSYDFTISTPVLALSTFTIMIKVKLDSNSTHNIFKYNDLSVDMTSTDITVTYGGTTESNVYTFDSTKWYAITLVYTNTKLSLYINEKLQNKYNDVTITESDNIVKLSDNSSDTSLTPSITFEDLRVYSNGVRYQTIYEYSTGLNSV